MINEMILPVRYNNGFSSLIALIKLVHGFLVKKFLTISR
jgi:hypothetical protein